MCRQAVAKFSTEPNDSPLSRMMSPSVLVGAKINHTTGSMKKARKTPSTIVQATRAATLDGLRRGRVSFLCGVTTPVSPERPTVLSALIVLVPVEESGAEHDDRRADQAEQ